MIYGVVERRVARAAKLAFAAALVVSASGCTWFESVKGGARVPPIFGRSEAASGGGLPIDTSKDQDVKDLRTAGAKPINLDTMHFLGDTGARTAYQIAADPQNRDGRERNRLQDYAKFVSDEVCSRHKSDILAVSSTINAGFAGLTTLLGGLGAIVTGESATRALSGSAAAANGLRDSINEHVFYNNVASAIVRQIEDQQKQKLLEIQTRRTETTDTYTVDGAIADIAVYHQLCSFSSGVTALANDGKRTPTADELRGRIDTLSNQLRKNSELIASAPAGDATRTILGRANADIANQIRALTMQLGLVQNLPPAPSAQTAEAGEIDERTGAAAGGPRNPLTAQKTADDQVAKAADDLTARLGQIAPKPDKLITDVGTAKTAADAAIKKAATGADTAWKTYWEAIAALQIEQDPDKKAVALQKVRVADAELSKIVTQINNAVITFNAAVVEAGKAANAKKT